MTISKKRSEESTNVFNIDQNDTIETKDLTEESETIEAGLIEDLQKKLSSKGEGGFFKSLLKSRRRIDTRSENKYRGNIVYEIDMCLLNDQDEVTVRIPAELRLEQAENNKINMYLKLPDKNYSQNKTLNDVDTSADTYRNMDNSKEKVGVYCWRLFNDLEYSKDDDFLKQFAVLKDNPDEAKFDVKNIKTITFLAPDPETGEEKEFKFKAIVEAVNKERTKVNISFIYPNPESLDDPESEWWENEDEYTNVNNTDDAILDKIVNFCEKKYGPSPTDWFPQKLTASQDVGEKHISSTKTMRIELQKVESSEGYDIELSAINATYNPVEAMEDVNAILDKIDIDRDFNKDTDIVVYDISVDDDELECNLVEEAYEEQADYVKCSIDNILNCEYVLYLNSKHMNYTACGKDMDKIQSSADNYSWRSQSQIDILSKLLVEYNLEPISPMIRIQGLDSNSSYTNDKTYLEDFKSKVSEDINCLIAALTLYSCNLPEDVQPMIEEFIRGWNYELNYCLQRSGL